MCEVARYSSRLRQLPRFHRDSRFELSSHGFRHHLTVSDIILRFNHYISPRRNYQIKSKFNLYTFLLFREVLVVRFQINNLGMISAIHYNLPSFQNSASWVGILYIVKTLFVLESKANLEHFKYIFKFETSISSFFPAPYFKFFG